MPRLARLAVALAALCLASPAAARERGDYGDAPDGGSFAYPSKERSNGARHTLPGRLLLGEKVNRERDSRQVDNDRFDDGFHPQLAPCATSRLVLVVDARRLSKRLRRAGHSAYLNAWFDWTGDGDWGDRASCGQRRVPEWALKNLKVDLTTFGRRPVQAIAVEMLAGPDINALWTRASVTLDKRFAKAARGRFRHGETEDVLFRSVAGPPPDGDPGPDPPPPNPDPRDIIPACVSKTPKFLGVDLLLKHGETGELQLLVWPPGRQVEFKIDVPPEVSRDLEISPLPDNRVQVRARDVDPPIRPEGYELEVTATSGESTVRFTCTIGVWHGQFTWYDETGDAVPNPDDPHRCSGPLRTLFDNWNSAAVRNGGRAPTFSTDGKAYCVHQIATYHWNAGRGKAPGWLFLTNEEELHGPFEAVGESGQGGARSVNWIANVPTEPWPWVINGTYTCWDSDPDTWSQNRASGGFGFCKVYVSDAEPLDGGGTIRR